MILILSTLYDFPTELVQQELLSKGIEHYRINEQDSIELQLFEVTPVLKVNFICNDSFGTKMTIDLTKVTAFWYRRGIFNLRICDPLVKDKNVSDYYSNLETTLRNFIEHYLNEKISINKFQDNFINKLIVLYEAQKLGLMTPATLLINENMKLPDLTHTITKDFVYPAFQINGRSLSVLTKKTPDISSGFSTSLIQDMIDKKYEIRTFFLYNELYSMAIFSQENDKTKLDFRNYDHEYPNRMVRYQLPEAISNKIRELTTKLGLNSGSIDLIVDVHGNFYFLEINPVGEWHFLSENCYYKIESVIANTLIYGKGKAC